MYIELESGFLMSRAHHDFLTNGVFPALLIFVRDRKHDTPDWQASEGLAFEPRLLGLFSSYQNTNNMKFRTFA